MKSGLIVFFLLAMATSAVGQTAESAPTKSAAKTGILPEAEEACKNFDFGKISINPNNLTRENIEDLKNDFLSEVKPYLIAKGERVARLARIAEPIFRFHKARNSQTVVFETEHPAVFTWKETFVTFSTGAMELLTDEEIAALIAHETGHLYFAESLAKAREDKNDRAARVIELKCDLVAFVTLSKLKIDPSNLISAVRKLIKKREKLGVGSFVAGSPVLEDREWILKKYLSGEKATLKKPGG